MADSWILQNKKFSIIVVVLSSACACALGTLYLLR